MCGPSEGTEPQAVIPVTLERMEVAISANQALVLLVSGLLLIATEFCLPGWVVPGVVGGVAVMTAIHQFTSVEMRPEMAAAALATVLAGAAAAYGWLPAWSGAAAILLLPWLCRAVAPGWIGWPAAAYAGAGLAVLSWLLRVAARAAENKTLLQ